MFEDLTGSYNERNYLKRQESLKDYSVEISCKDLLMKDCVKILARILEDLQRFLKVFEQNLCQSLKIFEGIQRTLLS